MKHFTYNGSIKPCKLLPLWEHGLKPYKFIVRIIGGEPVAPFMGAWIETLWNGGKPNILWLLPLWEHGLKRNSFCTFRCARIVAPFMGAWIETVSVS